MAEDLISLYRDRLAREKGYIKKDWGGKLSIGLVYPNRYPLGMANLGFQIVYSLLNSRRDVVAERVFLPDTREMELYKSSGKALLSLESQIPLNGFHLIALSLSYENDYPNILRILELGKVPLLSRDRIDLFPFVSAGGITTFLNPEPIAPFIDFFLLGEAEACLDHFLDVFKETISNAMERRGTLINLARNAQNLYVPSLYEQVHNNDGTLRAHRPLEKGVPENIFVARARQDDLPFEHAPVSTITTPFSAFGERALIETGRGCGRSCRFCAAGYVYRPPRIHNEIYLRGALEKTTKLCSQVGLVGAAISDVPAIGDITSILLEKGISFSVSSLRADSLTLNLLENLSLSGQRTVALAPEAGSERLRRVINKHLTKEHIIESAKIIAQTRHFNLRLYFLIGLPTETQEDVQEIVELVKSIRHHMIKVSAPKGRMGEIRLSINCFIPKPFTPFQWFPLEEISSLKFKQKWLKKALAGEGGIKVTMDVPRWSYIQALLSLGDRRAASMLLLAHQERANWTRALRSSEINPDFFVYRPKGLDELLPWDFISHGIDKGHLIKERQLALHSEESDICRVGECCRCGVCKPE